MGRATRIGRQTRETDIRVFLDLDGEGDATIDTGVPFLDHMLDAFARHGLFDLEVIAHGDVEVDDHHTVEDVGIVLGNAVREALGEARGITRYGNAFVPMDESLVLAVIDISGRGAAFYDLNIPTERVGTFDTQLVREFMIAFAANAGITLHVRQIVGSNSHHIIEAAFKAVARALMQATRLDPRVSGVPSTKGSL
ncbi:MAG: imidazoleglycerol-phosphate dehydratase HisB [Coriobacteriales bacterium]|nr:imidazoleglycerol-phosphate dehydratase HisB [Coriobacteriales bacterium]